MTGSRTSGWLLDASHQVSAYNRTHAGIEPLVQAGMRRCDAPRAVTQAAEFTLCKVTDSAALTSRAGDQ